MDFVFLIKLSSLVLILPVVINMLFLLLKGRGKLANSKTHPLVVISAFVSCFLQACLLIYSVV